MQELVRTALNCGNEGCGKRCGTAQRDLYGLAYDDIIVDFRHDVHERSAHAPAWRDSSNDTAAKIYSLTRHIDAWPMVWRCPHCRKPVSFDRDRARRVGHVRRLVAPAAVESDLNK
jgi:hypothetical protein